MKRRAPAGSTLAPPRQEGAVELGGFNLHASVAIAADDGRAARSARGARAAATVPVASIRRGSGAEERMEARHRATATPSCEVPGWDVRRRAERRGAGPITQGARPRGNRPRCIPVAPRRDRFERYAGIRRVACAPSHPACPAGGEDASSHGRGPARAQHSQRRALGPIGRRPSLRGHPTGRLGHIAPSFVCSLRGAAARARRGDRARGCPARARHPRAPHRRAARGARQGLLALRRRVPYDQVPACNPLAAMAWQHLLLRLTGLDLRRCPACNALSVTRRPLDDRARAPPLVA